jgi:hypothetical protein
MLGNCYPGHLFLIARRMLHRITLRLPNKRGQLRARLSELGCRLNRVETTVKNGPDALKMGCLFYPPKADIGQLRRHRDRRHDEADRQGQNLCEVPNLRAFDVAERRPAVFATRRRCRADRCDGFGDPVRQQSALLRITDLSQASRHVRKSGHERTSSRPIRSPRRRSPAALAAHCVDEQKRTRRCK